MAEIMEKIPHIKDLKYKGFHPLDKKKLIKYINEKIDEINKLIFDESSSRWMELTGDTRGYYSSEVFEENLNEKSPGWGALMQGLYADWYTSKQRNIIEKSTVPAYKRLNNDFEIFFRSTHLMSLEKIRESFDNFLKEKQLDEEAIGSLYKNLIKSEMKYLLALEWADLLRAAEKSVASRGIVRNIKKIPNKILDPLKQHLENVFGRNTYYLSLNPIKEYIEDFKNALLNHERSSVKNDTYDFFNCIESRPSNAFSMKYKSASDLGENVTNTTYLLFKYATGFSDVANTIYKQLVEKSERMVFEEIKTILGDKNSKFIDYMLKFANERISDNPEIKDKKELDLEDYKKSAYRLPFVNAFINLYGIIKEHKGSLSTREKSDINKFLNVKYKNYVCLEEPITNFNRSIDKETRRIIMSFINIFCDNQ